MSNDYNIIFHIKFKEHVSDSDINELKNGCLDKLLSICGLCKEFKKNICVGDRILCGRKYSLYKRAKKIALHKLNKRGIKKNE